MSIIPRRFGFVTKVPASSESRFYCPRLKGYFLKVQVALVQSELHIL